MTSSRAHHWRTHRVGWHAQEVLVQFPVVVHVVNRGDRVGAWWNTVEDAGGLMLIDLRRCLPEDLRPIRGPSLFRREQPAARRSRVACQSEQASLDPARGRLRASMRRKGNHPGNHRYSRKQMIAAQAEACAEQPVECPLYRCRLKQVALFHRFRSLIRAVADQAASVSANRRATIGPAPPADLF